MISSERGPLEGVRVVDFSEFVAAPATAKILADWGADVVKVERFEGDVWRWYGPSYNVPCQPDENPLFDMEHLNKQFLALNLKTDKGRDIMQNLVSKADIFVTNYRTEALKKLNLSYEYLALAYPETYFRTFRRIWRKGTRSFQAGIRCCCILGSQRCLA